MKIALFGRNSCDTVEVDMSMSIKDVEEIFAKLFNEGYELIEYIDRGDDNE